MPTPTDPLVDALVAAVIRSEVQIRNATVVDFDSPPQVELRTAEVRLSAILAAARRVAASLVDGSGDGDRMEAAGYLRDDLAPASCPQCGAANCRLRSRPPCAACGKTHATANVSTADAEIACCDRACGELLIGLALADATR